MQPHSCPLGRATVAWAIRQAALLITQSARSACTSSAARPPWFAIILIWCEDSSVQSVAHYVVRVALQADATAAGTTFIHMPVAAIRAAGMRWHRTALLLSVISTTTGSCWTGEV